MSRQLRIEYEGAIYHLLSRGDRREEIFRDDLDRTAFLQTLARTCQKTGWQVHAYCLMRNHFHLVVETPEANLTVGMKWFLGTYTMRFNRRHRLSGHLFAGRYKSLLVDGAKSDYLRTVCDYVHLNPARAGLVQERDRLEKYRWSSYPSYLREPRKRESWLRVDRLMGEHGLTKDNSRTRLEFARRMQAHRQQNDNASLKRIRRGWHYGAEDFLARLLDQLSEPPGEHHRGQERREFAEMEAAKIIRRRLRQLGWDKRELSLRRKSDQNKVRLAAELRARTSVSLKWIARELEMGCWSHVSNLLRKEPLFKSED